jgi:hypothetical protein
VDLYIGFNLDKFKTEVDKVMWAVSFLRGAAFDWIEVFLNDFMDSKDDDKEPETNAIFGSYQEYKKRLNRVFGDIDAKRSAERQLQGLRQHKSATTYAAEFQQYAGRTDWNDEALTAQFYKGLKDAVKDDIVRGDRPRDLQAMISMAIKIDNRLFERGLERRGHYSGGQGRKPQKSHWPQPMELDAAYRKPQISKDEMDRRRKGKLCFECGKEGHMANFHRKGKANKPWKKRRQLNATGRTGYNGPPRQLCVIDRKKGKGSTKKTRSLREEIEEVAEEFSKEELAEARQEHAQLTEGYETEDWDELEEQGGNKETEIRDLKLEVEHLKRQIRVRNKQLHVRFQERAKCGGDLTDANHPQHDKLYYLHCSDRRCAVHLDAKVNNRHWPEYKGPIYWDDELQKPDYERRLMTNATNDALNW